MSAFFEEMFSKFWNFCLPVCSLILHSYLQCVPHIYHTLHLLVTFLPWGQFSW
jgi:hypothetical protein